jgi:DNA polymerase III subunit gamma/tau
MTIALARRYRPKRFADLLVQDHVAAVLRGAVARGRVGHGYLLTGPRGVGKTTAARILAMALNCPNREPSGDPCGECDNCQRAWSGGANLDVIEIDAASNRGVDDARDLRERAMYAASREGHSKVYIVDEAHMLTREAWNALLKVLEEPPPGVVFVFATTEPQKIAAAAAPVLSRLQRFDFRRIGPAAIRDRLRQVLTAEMLALVADRRPAGVFPLIDRLVDAGADLAEFMAGAGETLRSLLLLLLGQEPQELTESMRQALEEHRERLEPGDVLRMLRLLAESEPSIRRSANPRLIVETLLLRWAMLDRIVDLAQVLAAEPAPPRGTPPAPPRESVRSASPAPAAPRPARAPATPAPRPSGSGPDAQADRSPVDRAGTLRPGPDQAEGGQTLGPVGALAVDTIPATLDGVRMAWGDLVAEVRRRSRFLGEALSHTAPGALELPWLTVELSQPNPLFAERLQAQAQLVEEVIAGALGQPVRLRVTDTTAGANEPSPRPQRLTEASLKADRLRSFRAKDPALDTAADALDLEIVD